MKLQESTSIGIVLGGTAIVVGYLAYLDSSPAYWALSVLLLAFALLNGKMMNAFRAAVSEEKRNKRKLPHIAHCLHPNNHWHRKAPRDECPADWTGRVANYLRKHLCEILRQDETP